MSRSIFVYFWLMVDFLSLLSYLNRYFTADFKITYHLKFLSTQYDYQSY